MVGFLIRGWDLILPGRGGTSILPREETHAAHQAVVDWSRAGEAGALGQGNRSSKTLD